MPLALDGYPELAEPEAQAAVLRELRALGVDTQALIGALIVDPDLQRLRAEREAMLPHTEAQREAARVSRWLAVLDAIARSPDAVAAIGWTADDLVERRAQLVSWLHRARARVAATDPAQLAARRLATSRPERIGVHRQTPPARPDATWPWVHEDAHLRAIRRYWVPTIIREVARWLRPTLPALRRRAAAAPAMRGDQHAIETAARAAWHRLIARLLLGFCPVWAMPEGGAWMSRDACVRALARRVRQVLITARRPRR